MSTDFEIPVMTYYSCLVARVLERNNITQDQLALESQVSPTQISRIISGSRVLSPEVIRALWNLTRDPEIFVAMTGSTNFIYIEEAHSDLELSQIETMAILQISNILNKHAKPLTDDRDRIQRAKDIDDVVSTLTSMRTRIMRTTQSTPTPPNQPTQQRNGQKLDYVA